VDLEVVGGFHTGGFSITAEQLLTAFSATAIMSTTRKFNFPNYLLYYRTVQLFATYLSYNDRRYLYLFDKS
jgi:hypothetical protein